MKVHVRAIDQERVWMFVSLRIHFNEEIIKMILFGMVLGMSYA